MAWFALSLAVVTEILWALSLKWASSLGNWQAAAVPIVLSFVNMGLLALAMRGLPAGMTYALWTGAGTVGVVLAGKVHRPRVKGGDLVIGAVRGDKALGGIGIRDFTDMAAGNPQPIKVGAIGGKVCTNGGHNQRLAP